LPAIVKVFAGSRAGAIQHPVGTSPSPSFVHIELVIRGLDDREDAHEARESGIHSAALLPKRSRIVLFSRD